MHYKSHIFRTISTYAAILGLVLNVSTISLAHADTTGITVDGSTCPVGLTTGPTISSDTSISVGPANTIGTDPAFVVTQSPLIQGIWPSIPGAQWIWSESQISDSNVPVAHRFSKTFDVTATTSGSIEIAADYYYYILLNSHVIGEGASAQGSQNFTATKTFNINSSNFVVGQNTLTIDVLYLPNSYPSIGIDNSSMNEAGVIFKLQTSTCNAPVNTGGSGSDVTAPTITPVADISTSTDSTLGTTVSFDSPTAIDAVDGTTTVACTPTSGSLFPIGTTTVMCTSKDIAQNIATSTFMVAVNLITAPDTGTTTATSTATTTDTTATTTDTTTPPANPVVSNPPVTPPGGSSGSFYGGNSYSSSGNIPPRAIIVAQGNPVSPNSILNVCPLISTFMQPGTNNNESDVLKLQGFLKNTESFDVDITGNFDAKTETAVRAFQSRYLSDTMGPWHSAIPTGHVYITTRKKINEIACGVTQNLSTEESNTINTYVSGNQVVIKNPVNTTPPIAPTKVVPTVTPVNTPVETPAPTVIPTPTQDTIGANVDSNTANTASVVNASVLQRVQGFFKGLFGK
jgi:hypothetical protein